MIEFSKSKKREVRNLAGETYKIELTMELEKLGNLFRAWQKGEIGVYDLDEHEYYSGPRKELYKSYEMLNQPETMVARALALGLINRDRVSAEVVKKIEHLVQFFTANG